MALVPLEIAVAMLNTGRQLRRNAATVRGDDEITTLRGSRLDVIVDQCLIEAVPWRAHISALSGPVAVGIFQAIAERTLEQTVAMEAEVVMTRVTTRR